eukprot:265988-Prorocentrum_minimum.AAC.21
MLTDFDTELLDYLTYLKHLNPRTYLSYSNGTESPLFFYDGLLCNKVKGTESATPGRIGFCAIA